MRIGRYTSDPIQSEIKRWHRKAGFLHKRNQKRPQTCIDMHRNVVRLPQCSDSFDIVHCTVREIRRRSHKL